MGDVAKSNDAPDDAAEAVRQALDSLYREAGDAYRRKDAAKLMELVTPDYVQRMPDGQILGVHMAQSVLEAWFATPEVVRDYAVQIGGLAVEGDEATGVVEENISTTSGASPGARQERTMANRSRVTWTRTADGWRIKRAEYLAARMSVDGVPANGAVV